MSICITFNRLCENALVLSSVGRTKCPHCDKQTMVMTANPAECTKCGKNLPEMTGFLPKTSASRLYYHLTKD